MSYTISVRGQCFWTKYKAEKHWVEDKFNGQQIPPRLVIQLTNGDIVVIANIILRDWRIYGLKNAIQRIRPEIHSTTTGISDAKSLRATETPARAASKSEPASVNEAVRRSPSTESASGDDEEWELDEGT